MKKITKNFISLALVTVLCLSLATFAFSASIRGDANFDGKVNSTDALMILQYSVGKELENFDEYLFDVNADLKINSTDALRVLKIAVGNDDPTTYKISEILKYYSDAMISSGIDAAKLSYSGTYTSLIKVSGMGESDSQEFFDSVDSEITFTNGVDENGYIALDYLPASWLDHNELVERKIEKSGDSYIVTIKLRKEYVTSDHKDDIPDHHFLYAGNYSAGFYEAPEGFLLEKGTVEYLGATLIATVSADGYMQKLDIEIPFIKQVTFKRDDRNDTLSVHEEGTIKDIYTFTF